MVKKAKQEEQVSGVCNVRDALKLPFCVFSWGYKRIRKSCSAPRVVAVRLEGVIGSGMRKKATINFESAAPILEKAFSMKRTSAVALFINSPGGAPGQTELIYRLIRKLSAKENKPVITFVEDVAASGGYWLACAGDEIYGLETSIVGSIGVVSASFGMVDAIKKIGVERRIYTEGKNKAMLDPFLPEQKEDVALLRELQRDLFESFTAVVKERRSISDKEGEELFTGAFWGGKRALSYKLIDKIGDAHTVLREKYGDELVLIELESKPSLFKRLMGSASASFAESLVDVASNRLWWSRYGL